MPIAFGPTHIRSMEEKRLADRLIQDAVQGRVKEQMKSLQQQIGGDHYKRMPYEPILIIRAMIAAGLWGWDDGNAAKYLFRWRLKNGIEDLKKARDYIDKLIEAEESGMCSTPSGTSESITGE